MKRDGDAWGSIQVLPHLHLYHLCTVHSNWTCSMVPGGKRQLSVNKRICSHLCDSSASILSLTHFFPAYLPNITRQIYSLITIWCCWMARAAFQLANALKRCKQNVHYWKSVTKFNIDLTTKYKRAFDYSTHTKQPHFAHFRWRICTYFCVLWSPSRSDRAHVASCVRNVHTHVGLRKFY